VFFLKQENEFYFDDLPVQAQELLIDMMVSILENKMKPVAKPRKEEILCDEQNCDLCEVE
jgi:hypothetical protein